MTKAPDTARVLVVACTTVTSPSWPRGGARARAAGRLQARDHRPGAVGREGQGHVVPSGACDAVRARRGRSAYGCVGTGPAEARRRAAAGRCAAAVTRHIGVTGTGCVPPHRQPGRTG